MVGWSRNPIVSVFLQHHEITYNKLNNLWCPILNSVNSFLFWLLFFICLWNPSMLWVSFLHSCSNSFRKRLQRKNFIFQIYTISYNTLHKRGKISECLANNYRVWHSEQQDWLFSYTEGRGKLSFLIDNNRYTASRGHVINISAHLTFQIYLFGKI